MLMKMYLSQEEQQVDVEEHMDHSVEERLGQSSEIDSWA